MICIAYILLLLNHTIYTFSSWPVASGWCPGISSDVSTKRGTIRHTLYYCAYLGHISFLLNFKYSNALSKLKP